MRALLFSGGIDSTALAWGLRPGLLIYLNYGQKAATGEMRAIKAISRELKLPLDLREAQLGGFGHGTMSGAASLSSNVPEFWPYRNQMLITLAAMAHADKDIDSLIIGTVRGDDRHPDGRPAFLEAIDNALAVQSGPRVEAPAANMTSEELVQHFDVPISILGWTFSCHIGEWACGACHGCIKHAQVLRAVTGRAEAPHVQ